MKVLSLLLAALPAAFAHATALSPHNVPWDPGAENCDSPDARRVEGRDFGDGVFVLRQNPCIDPEANFTYLVLGEKRALLIDTGASDGMGGGLILDHVRSILTRDREVVLPLLVAHTHGHQDHRAGDGLFVKLPNTQIAPIESGPLRQFFGFKNWPNDVVQIDLGNRIVDLIPTPGHHQDHIVFYDRKSQLLFTGDFLLPGRLLVEDIEAYRDSARRVADFAREHRVSRVLGAHLELDSEGNLYPQGSTWHPGGRPLPLDAHELASLPAALNAFNGFYSRYPNYVIGNPMHNLAALAAGILLVIVLTVWALRRLWKRRRAIARVSSS